MDLKKLIAKMDHIESKKILTESEKKETSWTDMKGKKHPATKVKGKSYGNQSEPKEVDAEGKEKKKVEEGLRIAKALLEAFGLDEAVAGNPWEGSDPVKSAAWAALTPEDQQWLGGADPTDQYILARAPNKGAKASEFAQVKVTSKQTKTAAQADADYMKNRAAGQRPTDANPYASANVTPDVAAGMRAANASATTGTPGAAGQPTPTAAKPAAKPAAAPDPKVQALQQQLIKAGANIKADGIMGPQTQAAMKQFPQAGTIGAQAALRKADTAAGAAPSATGQPAAKTGGAGDEAARKRMRELLAKAGAA